MIAAAKGLPAAEPVIEHPHQHGGNGARTMVVAIFVGLAVSFGSCAVKDTADQVNAISREIRPTLAGIQSQLASITARLDRIERLLDAAARR